MKLKSIFVLFLLCFTFGSLAQIPSVSFQTSIDIDTSRHIVKGGSQPVAKVIEANIQFPTQEPQGQLSDTSYYKMWVASNGAYTLSFFLRDLSMEPGVRLYFQPADPIIYQASYTYSDLLQDGTLITQPIPGDSILITLAVPLGIQQKSFTISKIYHDFSNYTGYGANSDAPVSKANICNSNVGINCPEGKDYQDIKQSVVKYSFEKDLYVYYCTGTLLNSIRTDTLPILLTSAHCVCNDEQAKSGIFYFNYESPNCGSQYVPNYQMVQGSKVLATAPQLPYINKYGNSSKELYPTQDFSLLLLPYLPERSKPYFAGISLSRTSDLQYVATIHHPDGGPKYISISYSIPWRDNYPEADPDVHYSPLNHWHIDRWDVGTTQGGSSGAPLLNTKKLVIGQLSGGYASCFSPVDDFYQMLALEWDTYAEPEHQLKHWLAPNSDITEIPSFDPYNIENSLPKSLISGYYNNDSSQVHLQWGPAVSYVFNCDFENFSSNRDINTKFQANVDANNINSEAFQLYEGEEAHSGSQCIKVICDADKNSRQYLTLPSLYLSYNSELSFWAKSEGGNSKITLSQNSHPARYQTIQSFEVGEEWTEYKVSLSRYADSKIYLNFTNITPAGQSSALYLDDIQIKNLDVAADPMSCIGYQLYCNNELVKTFTDSKITSYDFDIPKGSACTFYILNLYGDNEKSGIGNMVTFSNHYEPKPSTPVVDINPEENAISINLYPNPADREIKFLSNLSLTKQVFADLFDINGKIIKRISFPEIVSGAEYIIPVSDLSTGVYLLNIHDFSIKYFSQKVLVER